MKRRFVGLVAAAAMGVAGGVAAQEESTEAVGGVVAEEGSGGAANLGVGVKFGTLGYGVEVSKGITPMFNARLGFTTYSYTDTDSESDIEYDMDLNWSTFGAFADWHPFSGGFRLTLGYVVNNNEISMVATPAGSYEIGGISYPAALVGNLNGTLSFDNGLFYGLGWGNAADADGLGFLLELGILQQTPHFDLRASGPIALDPTFQQDLREEEAAAEKDLEDFDMYPVIALGLTYAF